MTWSNARCSIAPQCCFSCDICRQNFPRVYLKYKNHKKCSSQVLLLQYLLFFVLCFLVLRMTFWTAVLTVSGRFFSSFDFIFWIQCWRPCLPRVTRVVARLRPRTEKRRRVVTDLRDRMQRASLRLDGHCPALPPAGQLWCEPHVF